MDAKFCQLTNHHSPGRYITTTSADQVQKVVLGGKAEDRLQISVTPLVTTKKWTGKAACETRGKGADEETLETRQQLKAGEHRKTGSRADRCHEIKFTKIKLEAKPRHNERHNTWTGLRTDKETWCSSIFSHIPKNIQVCNRNALILIRDHFLMQQLKVNTTKTRSA